MSIIDVLIIDDDVQSLKLMKDGLPTDHDGHVFSWETCSDFEEGLALIKARRFDIVITDVYLDRKGHKKDSLKDELPGMDVVRQIRNSRFCPVLLITDGPFPVEIVEGPFMKIVDKTQGDGAILAKISELIETGIPDLSRKLHDELDKESGSYLWNFLEKNWTELVDAGLTKIEVLDRLLHRRASVQLGRLTELDGAPTERDKVHGAEFYLNPTISKDYRLGEIICKDDTFRVILTPHCHLTLQPGDAAPRADYVLTVLAVPAEPIFRARSFSVDEAKKRKEIARRIKSPAEGGKPDGRYWFLPGFLALPNLYVDFVQLQSLPYEELDAEWGRVAVLDVPYAEALQSCFVRFYSAVGIPVLDEGLFMDMANGS